MHVPQGEAPSGPLLFDLNFDTKDMGRVCGRQSKLTTFGGQMVGTACSYGPQMD